MAEGRQEPAAPAAERRAEASPQGPPSARTAGRLGVEPATGPGPDRPGVSATIMQRLRKQPIDAGAMARARGSSVINRGLPRACAVTGSAHRPQENDSDFPATPDPRASDPSGPRRPLASTGGS
jgi:hypothetical protein